MTDLKKLRELAKNAIEPCTVGDHRRFSDAAKPQAIIALIDELEKAKSQLAEANAVAEFYGNKSHWMTPWKSTECATDTQFMPLDDIENVEMKNKGHWRRIAGKRARHYLEKFNGGKI